MKKVYTILLAAACVAGVTVAQRSLSTDYTLETKTSLQSVREVKTGGFTMTEAPAKSPKTATELTMMPERSLRTMAQELTYATSLPAQPVKAAAAPAKAPASIVGNSYMTYYSDRTIDCTSYFTVAEGDAAVVGSIVLKNFAEGYDVNANYDATTGTITIPTGVVIGQYGTYGDLTIYALAGNQYGAIDITGTVGEDGTITFDYGAYVRVTAGVVSIMDGITAKAGNATYKATDSDGEPIEAPLLITKTSENTIKVVGIAAAILSYGSYIEVPLTLDATAKTVGAPFGTVFSSITLSTGVRDWYYGNLTATSSGNRVSDLLLNAATTDATTKLSADATFLGYQNGTSYSGMFIYDVTIDTDFNVYTAEVGNTDPDPDPDPQVEGDSYLTFYNDGSDDYTSFFTIVKGEGNAVVLKNFAEGYDVNATYDEAAGTITIPTGVVIGQLGEYGDITLYALSGTQYSTADIVGTFGEDGTITFDKGVYTTVSQGWVSKMFDITAKAGNAMYKGYISGEEISAPLIVKKTAENTIKVVGIASAILSYGSYVEVPLTLDAAAKTVGAEFGASSFCSIPLSTGVRDYYYGSIVNGYIDDLLFNAATTDAATTLTADATFLGYPDGQSFKGAPVDNVTITVDMNVFTAEVEISDDDTDTPEVEGILYKIDREAKTAAVTGCIATLTDLNIPATITVVSGEYTVTSVAANAFNANKTVTSVTLPATIAAVETDAFRNMSNLKTVNINDLTAWCGIVFANGNANPIYNVYPTQQSKWGSVKVAGEAVTTLEIPEGVTSLSRSFYGFKALTAVTLPSTLETLGDQSFANCVNLTEVVVPEGVTSIGSAFFGCSGLTTVTLPSSLVSLNQSTFYNCSSLTDVVLPEALETIGSMAFSGCKALTALTIPASLKTIGMMAFSGCTGIAAITSYAVVPPTAATYAFDDVDKTIPVKVYEESVNDYKEAAEWKDFTNYEAMPGLTGITDITAGAEKAVYYDLRGARVENPSAGIYIRKQGSTVTKVVVK